MARGGGEGISMGKAKSFQQMMLGQLDSYMQKSEIGPLTQHIKIKSQWIDDVNVRAKIGKLLEENVGENLHDIGFVIISWI